jgi:hypothetical protein
MNATNDRSVEQIAQLVQQQIGTQADGRRSEYEPAQGGGTCSVALFALLTVKAGHGLMVQHPCLSHRHLDPTLP